MIFHGNADFLPPLVAIAPLLVPAITTGLSLLSGLFKNKGAKPATNASTGAYGNTNTSTPTLAPEYKGLQDMILPIVSKRLSDPGGLPPGYLEGGLAKIGRTHDLVKQRADNNLTSRGLGTSPVAAHVDAVGERARTSDIVDFQNEVPMLERQMENDDLASAMSLMNFGRGNTSTGSGTNSGSGQAMGQQQGAFANGMDEMTSMLGFLIGQGAFGGGTKVGKLPIGGNPLANFSNSLPNLRF